VYFDNWLGGSTSGTALNFTFVPKWSSNLSTWMVFSTYAGDDYQDRFGLIHANLLQTGNGTLGGSESTPPATIDNSDLNTMSGSPITIGGQSVSVSSLSVWINSADPSPNNKFQVAIYSDNNGVPGSLVTSSGSQTISPQSWNTVSLSAILNANATYWLMYNTNAIHGGSNDMSYATGTAYNRWYSNAAVNFGTWPSTAPSGSTVSQQQYSIYVHFSTGHGTLGGTTPTPPATVDNSDFNTMSGSPIIVGSQSIPVSSITVWIDSADPSPHNDFQVAIYADSGGHPGSLVKASASRSITAQSWNSVAFSTTLNANTTYWLMYNTNALHGGSNDMSYATGSTVNRWFSNSAVNFGTWPSSAPSGTISADQQYSIYLTY
jgi:hypothetical protein